VATTAQITAPTRTTSPLALWHLLSLDAPTVAALWTCFIARATHTPLSPELPIAMFLAVWLLYAADRLLDTRHLLSARHRHTIAELEARHLFHFRHRRVFLAIMPLAALSLAGLLPDLLTATVHLYLIESVLLVGWFVLVHTTRSRMPKEIVVGLYFAAATFTPTLARRPAAPRTLLLEAALFAGLCTVNCLFIHAWQDNVRDSHPSLTTAAAAVGILSVAAALTSPRTVAIAAASALAATALLVLHRFRHHLSRTHLRAAADLALLTPALLLPFLR
jgi:hypothetical protein